MRINFFDIAKGIGMVLVVLSHTFPKGFGIQGFCESFHMPLFFFISGYFFSLDKYPLKNFFKRRFQQLIIPLITFSIIVGTLNTLMQGGFAFSNFILPDTLWFLWILFLVELLFMGLIKAYGSVVTYSMIAVAVFICSQMKLYYFRDPLYLQTIGNALALYSLGNAFAMKGIELLMPFRSYKQLGLKCALVWGGYFLIFIVTYTGLISTEISENVMIPTIPALVVALLGILVTINLSNIIDGFFTRIGNYIKDILIWIGKHTIVIMALHFACWHICSSLKLGFVLSQFIMWCVCLLFAFIFDTKNFKFLVGKR